MAPRCAKLREPRCVILSLDPSRTSRFSCAKTLPMPTPRRRLPKASSLQISKPTSTRRKRRTARKLTPFESLGYSESEKSSRRERPGCRKNHRRITEFCTRPGQRAFQQAHAERFLAERAEAMAKEAGLAVEILDEKKIADLKMGALLSVAQGSVEPPRVIVVTYTPANAKPGAPVIGSGREGRHLRHRRHLHQARRRHGKNEVRHGRRRHHAWRDSRTCRA